MATRHDEARPPLGLTTMARSLGSAVARVRRLVPTFGARPAVGASLGAFEATRQRLRAEIADLEGELERLHSVITTSAVVGNAAPGTERSNVDSLLAKSRRLRDRLHEKRYRLARVERSIARERRLTAVQASSDLSERRPPRKRFEPEPAPRASEGRNDPRVRAVFKAVDRAHFESRTSKLQFKRLAERLVDANANIRREAVTRLSELDHPAAFDVLMVAVGDPNERVRLAALNGLGGMSRAAPADLFRSFLHDRNSSLRLAALRGLASMGSGALAVTELTAAIEDADPAVRKTAATVLGWHRSKGKSMALVFPALALALRDEEESVRIAAAEALGSLCDARAVLPLIRGLTDESSRVRNEASRALRLTVGEEVDVVGKGLEPEERAAALKVWWAEARVHVVVGQGPAGPVDLGAEAAAIDDEGGEDYERLIGEEPAESEAPKAPEAGADVVRIANLAAAAAKEVAVKEAAAKEPAPAKAPDAAKEPAAKEAAPAKKAAPDKKATPPTEAEASAEADADASSSGGQFENLFPDAGGGAVGEEGEGEGEGSGDGEYEDPFGGGS